MNYEKSAEVLLFQNAAYKSYDGVRVVDVARISNALFAQFGTQTRYPQAPELCVEIMSPSNTWSEMHMKAGLYLKAGAKEVWIEPLNGKRTTIKPP